MASDRERDTTNDADLKAIREAFDHDTNLWDPIRKEADIDMRYVSGDPWDPDERQARVDAKRPVISPDELGQYFNQVINDVREHKRAIKVTPLGNGANDQTAQFRANLYREIERRSNAQQAYTTMFENTVQRSFGFFRISPQYVSDRSVDQELLIKTVMNPNMVTPDGDAVEPDGSDMKRAFVVEEWRISEFKRRFPKAKIQDFDAADVRARGTTKTTTWINNETLQLGEYWFLQPKQRTLIILVGPDGKPLGAFDDELTDPRFQGLQPMKGPSGQVIERDVDTHTVTMQLTNGVEILEETKFKATTIPIVPCYGKILYVEGKRVLMSMTRLGRDPQMLYAYYRTQQAEMAGMIPKAPVSGYEGQFRGHESDWQKANHEPIAFLQFKGFTEETRNQTLLPPPQRMAYTGGEQIQALELCAEGARRAIQAAMGTSPLPSQAQRRNEKSGVALKQIDESFQAGSFHFVDHYEQAITRGGVILEDWTPWYYNAPRDVTVREQNDQTNIVRVNDPNQANFPKAQQEPLMVGQELHDITLSTGPSNDSEREVANDLSDSLVQNIQMVQAVSGPQVAAKVLGMSIRLKNVGPLGDEMADLIAPKDQDQSLPPEVMQEKQKAQQMLDALSQRVHQLEDEKQAKEVENQSKERIAAQQAELEKYKIDVDAQTKLAVAEIGAKSKTDIAEMQKRIDTLEVMLGVEKEARLALHQAHHERTTQAIEHEHEKEMAQLGHDQALEQGAQQHAQAADLQAMQPETGA